MASFGIVSQNSSWLCSRRPSRLLNCLSTSPMRCASSTSRWKQRQGRDAYARDAKVQGLKSRAAFKLLEMDSKYRFFKGNGQQTVVDLGYAPGSWSQVALERTRPNGRVIGIDLIPAQPPRGVATFQGDFLSPSVQAMVKRYIQDSHPRHKSSKSKTTCSDDVVDDEVEIDQPSYIDMERQGAAMVPACAQLESESSSSPSTERLVDVVLSDMLMNTSGNAFRDHAGSMDLCYAALQFASDTLRAGGHFVCKFYQGPEDKELEKNLKILFSKVFREKPDSSRKESKEAYFIGLRRKSGITREMGAGHGGLG